ncbi:alpha/beta hydrolase [Kitasatospora sp. NPDC051170]|uniref:alpha/beta hydrolase n=1 Tax=Kitasatospora sp. NPDC051170 TaxID=3364056 RepID=UPI003795BC61
MPTPPPLSHPALSHPTRYDAGRGRVALVVPGVGYSPARPLLHFAREVLLRHGWTVQELWWQPPGDLGGLPTDDRIAWVENEVARAVDAEDGACGLLLGKSLGSLATGLAAERDLPAAWLTPLLIAERVAASLHAAKAPTLLIGGTADHWWNGPTATATGHQVLEIPSADHSLELPGDSLASIDILHTVTTCLDTFLGTLPTD